MKYKAIRGMEDILPRDVKAWQRLEEVSRSVLESFGYSEIRTPILEDTSIFVRGIGETTDIVTKEMYTFLDRKGRSLTLRPEGTAPIVRSYIEHSLGNTRPEVRLYYIGPMFRSERPQKGRSREFRQIGVEVIGTNSPYADSEVILQLDRILRSFGLDDFTIKLNSLGCRRDKSRFSESLRSYLSGKEARLCDDCKERMKKNVLRVLDCKNESCVQVVRNSPNISDNLCNGCMEHFEKVKDILKKMDLAYIESKNLVRGLDYYTGTVFEVTHSGLGSHESIAAGGRYDNLVKDLGGEETGAIGYAIGIERVLLGLKKIPDSSREQSVIAVATIGEDAKITGMKLAERLRENIKSKKIVVITDIKDASLKSQLRSADKNNAKLVIIIGEDEIKQGKVAIRDMAKKEQVLVGEADVVEEIRRRLG